VDVWSVETVDSVQCGVWTVECGDCGLWSVDSARTSVLVLVLLPEVPVQAVLSLCSVQCALVAQDTSTVQ
jgi:hypothetical protein